MKLTTKYIIKEIIPNYFIGLGFLSVILLVVQIFQLVRLVVEKNVPADKVIKLLLLYLPLILQLTIPIAVIVGTLLAIGRLSSDSEITAMRACGISLLRVFVPSILFGLVMTIVTLGFYEYIVPVAAREYAQARIQIYQINPTAELSKSLSYNTIDGIKISVDSVNSATNELVNVRINYINENKLIFAPQGLLLPKDDDKNVFPLILFNSTMQPANIQHPNVEKRFDEQHNVQQIIYIPDRPSDQIIPAGNQLWSLSQFYKNINRQKYRIALNNLRDYNRSYNYQIDYLTNKKIYDNFLKTHKEAKAEAAQKQNKKKLMDLKRAYIKPKLKQRRLQNILKTRNDPTGHAYSSIRKDEYTFHRKIVLAFSALAFALLGAPLGIFSKRAGKSLGLGVSILVIVFYFGMIFLGNYLMKREILSPIISNWYSNIVLYLMGFYYLHQRLIGK